MNKLFYWNAFQSTWILLPSEVQDFLDSIPSIQIMGLNNPTEVKIKILRTEMTIEELKSLPKIVR